VNVTVEAGESLFEDLKSELHSNISDQQHLDELLSLVKRRVTYQRNLAAYYVNDVFLLNFVLDADMHDIILANAVRFHDFFSLDCARQLYRLF